MGAMEDGERLAGVYKEMLTIASRQRELAGSNDIAGMEAASQGRSSLETEINSIMERIGDYPEEQRTASGVAPFIAEAARLAGEILEVDRSTMSMLEKRKSELVGQIMAADQHRAAMRGYRSTLAPARRTDPRFIDKSR